MYKDIRSRERIDKTSTVPPDPRCDGRVNAIHGRILSDATGGLCGFDADGEIWLAVDPAAVRVRDGDPPTI